jgi:hypothetical protein
LLVIIVIVVCDDFSFREKDDTNFLSSARSHPIIVIPMACDQATTFHIDREWAESLKGLRMNVPDNWWDGFTGHKLNGGVIAHIDLESTETNISSLSWMENAALVTPCDDAVVRYADETHRAFSSFHLPAHAVSDPAQEVVVVEETVDDDDNEDVDDDIDFTTPPASARNKR